MADVSKLPWTTAWRWYAVPAVVLVVLFLLDLAGLLDALRP